MPGPDFWDGGLARVQCPDGTDRTGDWSGTPGGQSCVFGRFVEPYCGGFFRTQIVSTVQRFQLGPAGSRIADLGHPSHVDRNLGWLDRGLWFAFRVRQWCRLWFRVALSLICRSGSSPRSRDRSYDGVLWTRRIRVFTSVPSAACGTWAGRGLRRQHDHCRWPCLSLSHTVFRFAADDKCLHR
ncbi:hypothetical protein CO731_03138 [Aminobacter sp. MSH1]|nr:hypothetical protein CO731_03138 [Aminobacter sp. MSH1]